VIAAGGVVDLGLVFADDPCDAARRLHLSAQGVFAPTPLEPECRGGVLFMAVQFRDSGLALP
jgi:hypothetical protein